MNSELVKAVAGLESATQEGIDIRLDAIRRRALYPDLDAMEKRTREIRHERAAIPLDQADQDVEHLLHHIDMLKRELVKVKKENLQ